MLDYIIVGDGIAGLFLTYYLNRGGRTVKLLGQKDRYAASTASTGIINPITGRSYALTWMADALLSHSEAFYTELEEELGTSLFQRINIYRELEDVRSQNNWTLRLGDSAYTDYFLAEPMILSSEKYKDIKPGMEICRSFWVNASLLVSEYRKLLKENALLRECSFRHDDLEIHTDHIEYDGMRAKKIIFAEGYGVYRNPWFSTYPFQYALGNTLVIECKGLNLNKIVKKGVFLIPLGEHRYQIGSTFIRNKIDPDPADRSSFIQLEEKLQSAIKLPYQILSQHTGIRSVVKDRRPLIGAHPDEKRLHIFNGLGTKGYSLGPYFADHMAQHLLSGQPLMSEVDIARF